MHIPYTPCTMCMINICLLTYYLFIVTLFLFWLFRFRILVILLVYLLLFWFFCRWCRCCCIATRFTQVHDFNNCVSVCANVIFLFCVHLIDFWDGKPKNAFLFTFLFISLCNLTHSLNHINHCITIHVLLTVFAPNISNLFCCGIDWCSFRNSTRFNFLLMSRQHTDLRMSYNFWNVF